MAPTPRLTPIRVDVPQRSEEWFKLRLGKVTASPVQSTMDYYIPTASQLANAIVEHERLGTDKELQRYLLEYAPAEFCLQAGIELKEKETRKKYREAIVAERLSGMSADPEPYVSYDMKWGAINEGAAIARYQLEHRTIVDVGPFLMHPKLPVGVSPDGLIVDTRTGLLGTIECKCLRTANHLYKIIKLKAVPAEYKPQIQMQLWISGRDFCDFIGFDSRLKEGINIFTQRVERDDKYIDHVLVPAVTRFLDECAKDERWFRKRIRERTELIKDVSNILVKETIK